MEDLAVIEPSAGPGFACRSCGATQLSEFVDLGMTPNANGFRRSHERWSAETFLPLQAFVCDSCRLVQLRDVRAADYFFNEEYAYFSSYSSSWLEHARGFVEAVLADRPLATGALVVEIASNDGYLLRYFKQHGINVLGVDPAANCAQRARDEHGIETIVDFFGVRLAETMRANNQAADLIVANNVLAHVPDINDFVGGLAVLLKPHGWISFEFPHLLELIRHREFDTIYHEHFSYLSLFALEPLLERKGLAAARVEKLKTHGGSLRLWVRHAGEVDVPDASIAALREEERAAGLEQGETYRRFASEVAELKRNLLSLLIELKNKDKRIAAYGAPAKGNTLLNYCGIRGDILDFTVDRSDWKQGTYLPGTGIPVLAPAAIDEAKPDYVLVLPWNLKDEITASMAHIREWGGRFIVPVPEPTILP